MNIIERLAARGITPEQALRDIERHPDYMKLIASDDGQELLAAVAQQAAVARGTQLREPLIAEEDER